MLSVTKTELNMRDIHGGAPTKESGGEEPSARRETKPQERQGKADWVGGIRAAAQSLRTLP